MGLFDKKFCDICGNKIGLLGNRKLEDGNCCKDCAKNLSPWFDERRHSTVAQIKEQLAYRTANRTAAAAFSATRTFGDGFHMLYVNEPARKLAVAESSNFAEENPDILDFSQVTGVSLDVRDHRRELKQKDAEGRQISFNPPQFEYEYEFYLVIRVSHPWFDEMRFKLNRNKLVIRDAGVVSTGTSFRPMAFGYEYQHYETMAKEISELLLDRSAPVVQAPPAAAAPASAPAAGGWTCAACGTANTGKFCSGCGAPRPAAHYRCDKCGWVPEDPEHPPKFCPNCGDPIDGNDRI